MFSIIYTPTEGDAIQNFSRLFRKPEGCFLNIMDQDEVYDNLSKFGKAEDIDYIVVTDGEEVSLVQSQVVVKLTTYYRSWGLGIRVSHHQTSGCGRS